MKNPTIRDMRKIELKDKYIRFSGEKGYSEQEWPNFKEIHEDNQSILLYLSKHNFFILPKRYFNREAVIFIKQKVIISNV
jgi:hypothetical protein